MRRRATSARKISVAARTRYGHSGVARTAEQANQMIDRGYLALALGFDWSLFQRGIAAAFQGIKR